MKKKKIKLQKIETQNELHPANDTEREERVKTVSKFTGLIKINL